MISYLHEAEGGESSSGDDDDDEGGDESGSGKCFVGDVLVTRSGSRGNCVCASCSSICLDA